MVTVESIKTTDDGRVILRLHQDGESTVYNVPASLYGSMSFVRGGRLTDDELSAIKRADEEYRAMKKALSLLGYSDKNRRSLYLRLLREGFSREVVEKVVERCLSLGYIRETDQLERLILREANTNLRGPRYIREKLAAKGYNRSDIDSVMDSLVESGEIDFRGNLQRLYQKHGADTDGQRRTLAYKHGYGSGFFDD